MSSSTIRPAATGRPNNAASTTKSSAWPSRSTSTITCVPGTNWRRSLIPQPTPAGIKPSSSTMTSSALKPAPSAGLPGMTSAITSLQVADSARHGATPSSRPSLMPIPENPAPPWSRAANAAYSLGVMSWVNGSPNDATISAAAAQTAAAVSATVSISWQACSNTAAGKAQASASSPVRGASPACRTPSAAAAARSSSRTGSTNRSRISAWVSHNRRKTSDASSHDTRTASVPDPPASGVSASASVPPV